MPRRDDPPLDPTPWQIGDLALCVGKGKWFNVAGEPRPGPNKGSVDKVTDIKSISYITMCGVVEILSLSFETHPYYYDSTSFRKIEPHVADDEDRETMMLQAMLPERRPEPQLTP
jgi:hypothetical protein